MTEEREREAPEESPEEEGEAISLENVVALDEEDYDPDEDSGEPGPMIDEDAGALLDRLADEQEDIERREGQSEAMNSVIRRGFGRRR